MLKTVLICNLFNLYTTPMLISDEIENTFSTSYRSPFVSHIYSNNYNVFAQI